jgi:hypothetical protein
MYGPSQFDWGWDLGMAVVAWLVCIAGWVVVSMAGPIVADNRPRLDIEHTGVDPQLLNDPVELRR